MITLINSREKMVWCNPRSSDGILFKVTQKKRLKKRPFKTSATITLKEVKERLRNALEN